MNAQGLLVGGNIIPKLDFSGTLCAFEVIDNGAIATGQALAAIDNTRACLLEAAGALEPEPGVVPRIGNSGNEVGINVFVCASDRARVFGSGGSLMAKTDRRGAQKFVCGHLKAVATPAISDQSYRAKRLARFLPIWNETLRRAHVRRGGSKMHGLGTWHFRRWWSPLDLPSRAMAVHLRPTRQMHAVVGLAHARHSYFFLLKSVFDCTVEQEWRGERAAMGRTNPARTRNECDVTPRHHEHGPTTSPTQVGGVLGPPLSTISYSAEGFDPV